MSDLKTNLEISQQDESKNFYVKSIFLKNFRNFSELKLEFDERCVIITGNNGIGKTNLLEAISFLAPGKGLRSCKLTDIYEINTQNEHWKIEAIIAEDFDRNVISIEGRKNEKNKHVKEITVNGKKIKTISSLASFANVSWLTPQMDHIFIGPAKNRRKFIDRMSLAFEKMHGANLTNYELQMRQRLTILKDCKKNNKQLPNQWLDLIELDMAKFAEKTFNARNKAINLITTEMNNISSSFPKAHLEMENHFSFEHYSLKLKEMRSLDQKSGKTNFGIHRDDLKCFWSLQEKIPAHLCSTGQQKSLLISIIIAKLRADLTNSNKNGAMPIILLDEVVAHLDETRRIELFDELASLKVQAWITGTDPEIFSHMKNKAQFIKF